MYLYACVRSIKSRTVGIARLLNAVNDCNIGIAGTERRKRYQDRAHFRELTLYNHRARHGTARQTMLCNVLGSPPLGMFLNKEAHDHHTQTAVMQKRESNTGWADLMAAALSSSRALCAGLQSTDTTCPAPCRSRFKELQPPLDSVNTSSLLLMLSTCRCRHVLSVCR